MSKYARYWNDQIPSAEEMDAFSEYIGKECAKIPAWKRVLICWFLKRGDWKIARAYSKVGCHNFACENGLFKVCKYYGAHVWAEIYNIPKEPVKCATSPTA